MKKKKKNAFGDCLYYLTIIILLGIIAFSSYKVVPYMWNKYINNKEIDEIRDKYVIHEEINDTEEDDDENKEDYELYEIDFDKLKKTNSDIVAWIRFDNPKKTPIDYPVLYAANNNAYLRTNIHKKYAVAGSIFIEEKDDANLTDTDDMTTIIYGHNMTDNTMFGSLQKYRYDNKFHKKNQYFTIYTQEAIYRYKIFSCFVAKSGTTPYYTSHPIGSEKYKKYINFVCQNSLIDTGVVPSTEQHIVMLSTCVDNNSSNRTTVYGVLENVSEYTKEKK